MCAVGVGGLKIYKTTRSEKRIKLQKHRHILSSSITFPIGNVILLVYTNGIRRLATEYNRTPRDLWGGDTRSFIQDLIEWLNKPIDWFVI